MKEEDRIGRERRRKEIKIDFWRKSPDIIASRSPSPEDGSERFVNDSFHSSNDKRGRIRGGKQKAETEKPELGLTSNEYDKYEKHGYVMSGSRNLSNSLVKMRSENQTISWEEKKQILQYSYQERKRKEEEIVSEFKEMAKKPRQVFSDKFVKPKKL
jgi:hypothetical protein